MDEMVLAQLRQLVTMAYAEDGERDATSELLISESAVGGAVIVAKQEGVVCGVDFVEEILFDKGQKLMAKGYFSEGDRVLVGDKVLELSGNVWELMRVERVLLNFLGRLSGIATLTRQFVDKCEPYGVEVLGTRKTVPGWRYLDVYAIRSGGGDVGRVSLADGVMVKDNHWDAVGGVDVVLDQLTGLLRRSAPRNDAVSVVVEVRSVEEMKNLKRKMQKESKMQNFSAQCRFLLDNFSVEEVREAVEVCAGRFDLEVSGGVTLENVEAYAEALGLNQDGQDPKDEQYVMCRRFISIGALTHSVKGFDFSMRMG